MASSGSSMESTVTSTSSQDQVSLTRAHRYRAVRDLLNRFRMELSNDNRFMEFLQVANQHAINTNRVRQEVSNRFPARPDLLEAFNGIFPGTHSSEDEISAPRLLAIIDLFDQFRIELPNDNMYMEFLRIANRHAHDTNRVRQEVSNYFPARPDLLEAFNQIFPDRHSSEDEILFIALEVKAIMDLLDQFRIALSNDNRFEEFLQVVMRPPHDLNRIRQEVSNLFPERPDLVGEFDQIFPDRHSSEDEMLFTIALKVKERRDLFNQFRIEFEKFLQVVIQHVRDLNMIRQEVSNLCLEHPDLFEAFNLMFPADRDA